jgi:DNA-binding NtrC family response regulator
LRGPDRVGPELSSTALREVLALAQEAARRSSEPVLIVGESGSPTEELARFIHERSGGTDRSRFVVVPCAGVPEGTLEEQLVREAAALRRAEQSRANPPGPATLFIDGLSELGAGGQTYLGELIAAARSQHEKHRMRVIGSMSSTLMSTARGQAFRPDLLEQLSTAVVRIPPLRERRDDIERLASIYGTAWGEVIGRKLTTIGLGAVQKLRAHHFPGNERELRTVVERACLLEAGGVVSAESIQFEALEPREMPRCLRVDLWRVGQTANAISLQLEEAERTLPTLAELERAYLILVLERANGNRTAAARALGVSYPTVNKKIRDYKIDLGLMHRRLQDLAVIRGTAPPSAFLLTHDPLRIKSRGGGQSED